MVWYCSRVSLTLQIIGQSRSWQGLSQLLNICSETFSLLMASTRNPIKYRMQNIYPGGQEIELGQKQLKERKYLLPFDRRAFFLAELSSTTFVPFIRKQWSTIGQCAHNQKLYSESAKLFSWKRVPFIVGGAKRKRVVCACSAGWLWKWKCTYDIKCEE